ncbi:U3 small nucleolar RNA-associated protein 13 [Nematocida sp. AWRm77]|nr:U3 small nucleolar RNA-associated protein 13 [Nematocida sp. AWRm77]
MEGLQQKAQIRAVFDGSSIALHEESLFATYGESVVQINHRTGEIEKEILLSSTATQLFFMHCGRNEETKESEGVLVIATVGGMLYTYSPEKKQLEYFLKVQSVVKVMEEYNGHLALGTSDGLVIVVDVLRKDVLYRKVLDASITCIRQQHTEECKREYRRSRRALVVGDVLGNVFVVDTEFDRVVYKDSTHGSSVTLIECIDGAVYTGSTDGCVIIHRPGQKHTVREVGHAVTSGAYHNGVLLVVGESSTVGHYSTGLIQERADTLSVPHIRDVVVCGETVVLLTEEHDICMGSIQNSSVHVDRVIVGNNDEITDLHVQPEHVVISTNSSYLRVMSRRQLEYSSAACMVQMLASPNEECSLSLAGTEDVFFSGTKDGWINGYRTVDGKVQLFLSAQTPSPVTALCLHKNMLISGADNGMVSAWKVEGDALSLLFGASVSSSEITGVCVLASTILCTSKDKEVKRLKFSGLVQPGLAGHKKGIWSLDVWKDSAITGSSDKTARVWKDGSPQYILQHNVSVIKTLLGERAITATSEGVVRVWDPSKEKELAALRLASTKEERIWSIKEVLPTQYLVSAGGTLFQVQDNTKEIERQKEEQKRVSYLIRQKGDMYMKQKEYVSAAVEYFKLSTQKEIREAIQRISPASSIEPLVQEMRQDPAKSLKYISKWCRSPQLLLVSHRFVAEIIASHWSISSTKIKELSTTLLRTSELLNSAY